MIRSGESRFRVRALSLWLASIALLAGCSGSSNNEAGDEAAGANTVYVVNYPLQYFAERIGGEHVEVHFPCPPDEDPAYWQPSAEVIRQYQRAALILRNGADYAEWITSASLPTSRMIDTSAALADRYIEITDQLLHSHGPTGRHAHAGIAFTTWLDPTLAIEQARAIRDAMIDRWPGHEASFNAAFDDLASDLEQLDEAIARLLAGHRASPLIGSHPVFQYFTARYNLNMQSVHWEPDEAPTDEQWSEFESLLADHPARVMIWEGEPLQATRTRLAALGITCAIVDPCGNVPVTGDYLAVMLANVESLAAAFESLD